jgi:hypothetical protein
MQLETYIDLKRLICKAGFEQNIKWAQQVGESPSPEAFTNEYIFVVCNSGMKAQIARSIYERVMVALHKGQPVITVFGHKGKVAAIEHVYQERRDYYNKWKRLDVKLDKERLDFLQSLPWSVL